MTSFNQNKRMCKKWSHCNGWLIQVERMWKAISLWWVTYQDERRKKCEVVSLLWVTYSNERWWSHYDGWPTQMENEKNIKWSHYYGWHTQMKDVMWQVWKIGLTWRSPEGMTREELENLMLLDKSWSQGLKTEASRLQGWSFHFFEIFLMVGFISSSSYSMINTDSLLSSTQCFFFFSTILLDLIEDFTCNNSKTIVQCFEVRWHACILTWYGI